MIHATQLLVDRELYVGLEEQVHRASVSLVFAATRTQAVDRNVLRIQTARRRRPAFAHAVETHVRELAVLALTARPSITFLSVRVHLGHEEMLSKDATSYRLVRIS